MYYIIRPGNVLYSIYFKEVSDRAAVIGQALIGFNAEKSVEALGQLRRVPFITSACFNGRRKAGSRGAAACLLI